MFLRNLALGVLGISALSFALIRCSDDKPTLVRVANQAAGADCPAGGYRILSGADDNGNGRLDDNEVDGNELSCAGTTGSVAGCDLRPNGYCAGADLRRIVLFGTTTDLSGVDFTGADLRGAIFVGVQARNANFTGAKLDDALITGFDGNDIYLASSFRGANFSNASLRGIRNTEQLSFDTANLTGADFSKAQLFVVGFTRVTAPGAKFVGASIFGGFSDSDFNGADFTDAVVNGFSDGFRRSNITNANFTRAHLTYMAFGGNDLTGTNFTYASLQSASFAGVPAAGATFTNAYYDTNTVLPTGLDPLAVGAVNLSNLSLVGKDLRFAELRSASFSGYNLSDADFSGNDLDGARFTSTVMNRTKFVGASMQGARFDTADCNDADFTDADLSGSTVMAGSTFFQAKFIRTGLQHVAFGAVPAGSANFNRATLAGTTLATVTGTGQTWTDAYVTSTTTLPAGATGTISIEPGTSHAGADLTAIKLTNRVNDAPNYGATDDFSGANFTGAHLFGLYIFGANFSNTNFTNAVLEDTRFPSVNLSGASFSGANLKNAVLSDANLTNANLTNASLLCVGAGLETSDLALANFTGVTWTNTVCPDNTLSDQNTPANCEGHLIDDDSPWTINFCGDSSGEVIAI